MLRSSFNHVVLAVWQDPGADGGRQGLLVPRTIEEKAYYANINNGVKEKKQDAKNNLCVFA